jgi:hypothetical protein
VRQRDLNEQGAPGAADVDHTAVIYPGKLHPNRPYALSAELLRRTEELVPLYRVGVEPLEEVLDVVGFVLGEPGP